MIFKPEGEVRSTIEGSNFRVSRLKRGGSLKSGSVPCFLTEISKPLESDYAGLGSLGGK
jgi:hypothetical protein